MQPLFRKSLAFNSLLLAVTVIGAYGAISRLPTISHKPQAITQLEARPVRLPTAQGPFRLAGAWELSSSDRRLGGISGLAFDGDRLVAVSDLGAAVSMTLPKGDTVSARLASLTDGPGPFGYKVSRDAEAVVADGHGGWLVAFEQRHSVWRYTADFSSGRQVSEFGGRGWPPNYGVEALIQSGGEPVAFAQSGREILTKQGDGWRRQALRSDWEVADAAVAPDHTIWLLVRRASPRGFEDGLARLVRDADGYAVGRVYALPKGALDNLEGLAIDQGPVGPRFWLISDDGHYLMARTLLVALDLPQTQENARR